MPRNACLLLTASVKIGLDWVVAGQDVPLHLPAGRTAESLEQHWWIET
jgi:hypothetical protein